MIVIFILGYLAIALEHPLKIDKAASALLIGGLCWTALVVGGETIFPAEDASHIISESLAEHLSDIAGILFFLLGAMTIVELIDAHEGFRIITDKIETTSRVRILWIVCLITFFLSASLDNLTTAIVMAALLRKLMKDQKDLWMFGGMVIIAANAGGAWSPIGDVTTIMLWIGGQVTALHIIKELLIPSLVCIIVPLVTLSFIMKGDVRRPVGMLEKEHLLNPTTEIQRKIVLTIGIAGLLFVPVFKTLTHLPPFVGMILSLGVIWLVTELMHRGKSKEEKGSVTVIGVLTKVDVPTILFFLGILLAVSSFQTAGHLTQLAVALDNSIGNIFAINSLIGVLSAVVDNVPLVAGAMGMYSLSTYPTDHLFWDLLAYCAGTGGSLLIIGSAAGVAVMGIMKIDFVWYLKNISWLAAIGYIAGIGVLLLTS